MWEDEEVEEVENVEKQIVCVECKDTGAVPENIEKGVVTKWADCPKCYRYEFKDASGKPASETRRLIGKEYD